MIQLTEGEINKCNRDAEGCQLKRNNEPEGNKYYYSLPAERLYRIYITN